jgi:hypothetical protein
MYKISELGHAREDFRHVFNMDIKRFLDNPMTAWAGHLSIDFIAFDDYLHKLHGDYEDRGLSMRDVVIENYGAEADEILDKLII